MARSILIPATLAGVLVAASSAAQVTLDKGETQVIQDWVNKNNIDYISIQPAATWQFVGATPGGVTLRAVLQRRRPPLGPARVGLRIEHFQPVSANDMMALSELAAFQVDCNKDQIKLISTTAYAGHNFQGAKKEKMARAEWSASGTIPILDGAIRSACDTSR
jgi:hypothetical protein